MSEVKGKDIAQKIKNFNKEFIRHSDYTHVKKDILMAICGLFGGIVLLIYFIGFRDIFFSILIYGMLMISFFFIFILFILYNYRWYVVLTTQEMSKTLINLLEKNFKINYAEDKKELLLFSTYDKKLEIIDNHKNEIIYLNYKYIIPKLKYEDVADVLKIVVYPMRKNNKELSDKIEKIIMEAYLEKRTTTN